mgnify:CR=1 FL=1
MKTLREAVETLRERGYDHDFHVEDGKLASPDLDRSLDPTEVRVDEVHRFEGATDPGDMSILFALSDPKSDTKGTWSAPFGASAGPEAADMLRRLPEEDGGPISD